MNTRRFFILFCLGFILPISFLPVNVFLSLNNRNEAARWVAECLIIKDQAVVNHDPKLIILSGSNSLFGFSAKRLTDEYGITAVNTAVHAGLGVDYMLHYGRKHLKEGRIFILPLEYEIIGSSKPEETQQLHVIGHDPEYFTQLSSLEKLKFIAAIFFDTHRRLFSYTFWPEPKRDGGYQSKTLNEYGDETNNNPDKVTPEMLAPLNAKSSKKYQINNDVWNEIAQFSQDAIEAGAIVVLAFPNIYTSTFDPQLNAEFFAELKNRSRAAKIPLIGEPEDRVFGENYAYDTTYHQNTAGQMHSTDILYQQLVNANILQPDSFLTSSKSIE